MSDKSPRERPAASKADSIAHLLLGEGCERQAGRQTEGRAGKRDGGRLIHHQVIVVVFG